MLEVFCLCADWCGVCRDYAARFAQAEANHPQCRFTWIDIEDRADLVDPLEVESFPTLLLVRDGLPRFLGPITPQPETLERLLRAHLQAEPAPALADGAVRALAERLAAG